MSISPNLDTSATTTASRVSCICAILFTYTLRGASASAVSFVQTLEAAVIAEKAAREKRLAGAREREAERRREADRQKAAANA
jgi:hypothetical protein